MHKKIKKTLANPLFSGSAFMIVGSLGASFFSYLYHPVMGKMLGPENYGVVAAIISLVGLIGLLPTSLGLVVTKFISAAQTDQDKKDFITYFYRRIIVGAIIAVLILSLLSPLIASFLHINQSWYLVVAFIMFLFFIPSMFLRAALQGLLKFKEYVISFTLENFAKVSVATLLVYLGFKISGAVASLAIASFIGLVFAHAYLRKFIQKHERTGTFNLKPVAVYALPVFIQSLATTSLYSTDLLLVKHFFSAFDAGIYATLSVSGRMIFFGASPIAAVMFPLISQKHSQGKAYKRILLYSLVATVLLSLSVLLVFGLFPALSIKILYDSKYLSGAGLLFIFGLFMSVFTISYLLINFFLAIGKVKVVILPVIAALFQIIGICFFHASLGMVINISLISSFVLFISLISYYFLVKI